MWDGKPQELVTFSGIQKGLKSLLEERRVAKHNWFKRRYDQNS